MYATPGQAAILRAAVAAIKKHPETFDMDTWGLPQTSCGTVCCLAGQIVWNSLGSVDAWNAYLEDQDEPVSRRAADVLGMHWDIENWPVGPLGLLFLWPAWPVEFRPHGAPTPEQLEARVEHWILTGE